MPARAAIVAVFLLVCGTGACSTTDDEVGGDCHAVGGSCALGSAFCAANERSSSDDCNPHLDPGGGFCCLSPADAADTD